jgi:hypothetical protein
VPEWIIRPYAAGDETELVVLFERVFGRPMSEAQWRWKLAERAGHFPNVFLAMSPAENGRERPMSQCAAIPVRYSGPSGEIVGLVAVDAMTAPEFRRRGLLTEVNRHAYECWRTADVPFIVGLPNQQWGSRTTALGWRELFPLTWRVRPIDFGAIGSRRFGTVARPLAAAIAKPWNQYWGSRNRIDPTIAIRRASSLDVFDDLWRRRDGTSTPTDSFTIVRDRAWIEWRYLRPPDHEYRIWIAERHGATVGYYVSRLRAAGQRRIGYIAEFGAAPEARGLEATLLAHAVADLGDDGAEAVASLARPECPADRALRGAGFVFSWGSFSVQAVPLQSTEPPLFSTVFGGDFDVV